MGARIEGAGSSTLTDRGRSELHPGEHATVPDRIVAGTWAVAAAITGGDVFVRGAIGKHFEMALDKLASAGATIHVEDDGFRVRMDDARARSTSSPCPTRASRRTSSRSSSRERHR